MTALAGLADLNLASNSFSGTFPSWISALTALRCGPVYPFPSSIRFYLLCHFAYAFLVVPVGTLRVTGSYVDVSSNALTGTLPSSMTLLSRLV